ncbi:MAG: dienelactone hydrolase family protein [Rhodospirillales bacterium]
MAVPRTIVRAFLTAGLFLLGGLIASSASAASIEIELTDGAPPISAHIYKPSGKGPHPGVFVLHHSAGFTDSVKDFSDELSEKGFVTMAVDFSTRGWFDAHFAAAYDYLRKLPEVDGRRIGWVGFSKGARLGMGVVANWKNESPPRPIRAFVSYYIGNSIDTMPTPDLPPILFLHGKNDPEVAADLITMFCDMQKRLGGACEAKIYEGASHAFDRDTFYGSYDHRATVDALKRTGDFLNKYLKGTPIN